MESWLCVCMCVCVYVTCVCDFLECVHDTIGRRHRLFSYVAYGCVMHLQNLLCFLIMSKVIWGHCRSDTENLVYVTFQVKNHE